MLESEQYLNPDDFDDPDPAEMFTRFVKSSLKEAGYDGPNDYHAIYWFAKGRHQQKQSSFQSNEVQQSPSHSS